MAIPLIVGGAALAVAWAAAASSPGDDFGIFSGYDTDGDGRIDIAGPGASVAKAAEALAGAIEDPLRQGGAAARAALPLLVWISAGVGVWLMLKKARLIT